MKEHISASLRALAKKNVEVSYQLTNNIDYQIIDDAVTLPETDEGANHRFYADSAAARLRFHDKEIHQKYLPAGKEQSDVFEALERARAEILLAQRYKGVFVNVAHEKKFNDSPASAFAEVLWNRALGLNKGASNLIGKWIELNAEKEFSVILGAIEEQEKFAKALNKLIKMMEKSADSEELLDITQESDDDEDGEQRQGEQEKEQEDDADPQESSENKEQSSRAEEKEAKPTRGKKAEGSPNQGHVPNFKSFVDIEYKPYTTEFDEVVTQASWPAFRN